MAVNQGLQFGSDVIFNYGPLGFLRVSGVWDPGLAALSWLYMSAVFALACVGLVAISRRSVGPWVAAILVFAAVGLLDVVGLIEFPLLLAVLLCMLANRSDRSRRAVPILVFGGAVLAAIEMLTKFSSGPPILLILVIGLVGAGVGWKRGVQFTITLTVSFLVLWLLAGQSLAGIPDYLLNSMRISSAYREAMADNSIAAWPAFVAAGTAIIVITSSWFGDFRDRTAKWAMFAVVIIAAVLLFKLGTWRYGMPHLTVCLSTLVLIWIAIPRTPQGRWLFLPVSGLLVAVAFYTVSPTSTAPGINAIANLESLSSSVKTELSRTRMAGLLEGGRNALRDTYGLDQRVLSELEGRRVMVEPTEIGVAWAYGFDWVPVPTLQNYIAHTSGFDQRNASLVESPDGPERILRPSPASVYSESPPWAIDSRLPAWDPPAQQRAIYCNFKPVVTSGDWQVLSRVGNRCGPLEPLQTVDSAFGETVRVPFAGVNAVTILRLYGAEVKGTEVLWSLLVRAKPRWMDINDETDHRIVPGTATDGLMVRGGVKDDSESLPLEIPQARELTLTGLDGELRYEFFRMPVDP
jgi:hypothetical protein